MIFECCHFTGATNSAQKNNKPRSMAGLIILSELLLRLNARFTPRNTHQTQQTRRK